MIEIVQEMIEHHNVLFDVSCSNLRKKYDCLKQACPWLEDIEATNYFD